ncbi:7743_t:CDS:2, partial [Acaulospora colombiana]
QNTNGTGGELTCGSKARVTAPQTSRRYFSLYFGNRVAKDDSSVSGPPLLSVLGVNEDPLNFVFSTTPTTKKCSSYTRQHWDSVSSKFLMLESWRNRLRYGKSSKVLKKHISCEFHYKHEERMELTAIQEGKIPKTLKQFLTNEVIEKGKGKEVLAVSDTKLGKAISKKLGIEIYSKATQDELLDLYRGIREQITTLLNGLDPKDLTTMSLGLSHSLS